MRSGSTLLSQILCSHRNIVGYGETHIRYDSDESFVELITKTLWDRHVWRLSPTYFFDKILHAELIEDISLLSKMPIDWILLRRNGVACVRSMVRTFGMSPEHATAYFKRQWLTMEHWITELSRAKNTHITAVEYDDLINTPDDTLGKLSENLGLTPALSRKYNIQRGARKPGAGDSSGQLEHGDISRIHHDIVPVLSPDITAELHEIDERNKSLLKILDS